MSTWRDEYLTALKERDKVEKANYDIYDAYTKLADRTATLEAGKAIISSTEALSTFKAPSKFTEGTGDAQLKVNLAEALRSKGQLQTRLKTAEEELDKLKAKTATDNRLIRDLTAERNNLALKFKDRDEELKGKAKLIEDVQDEMISLNLQLNMAEQRSKKLQQENKDLVDRWMARMGKEADAMNEASKFS